MTQQEIFDTVAKHILDQGKPSTAIDGSCMYRGTNNMKCAVGCLIPFDVYDPKMEGEDSHIIIYDYDGLAHLREHEMLLQDLQSAHDNTNENEYFISNWKIKMFRVGSYHHLNTDVLGEA